MSVHSIASHLLKQTSYFPALKNRFVCLDLTHSLITTRCVAVFAKKVNFVCVNCLHTQWSCMHCKIIYVHAAWYKWRFIVELSPRMNRNDPPENASLITAMEGKCQIIHIKFRINISLVWRVKLAVYRGREIGLRYVWLVLARDNEHSLLVLVFDLPFPQFSIY